MLKYSLGVRAFAWAIIAAGTPLTAWMFVRLWQWFVVPLGAPKIGMAHAYGLYVLVFTASLFWPTTSADIDEASGVKREATREEAATHLAFVITKRIVLPLVTLGIGCVAHYFMTF